MGDGWDGCVACPDNKACLVNTDCSSGLCENNVCVSCSDKKKNGHEACVDGGGRICRERCENGESCNVDSDCSSGICYDNPEIVGEQLTCVACDNNYRDGNETCIDGGGGICSRRCEVGEGCRSGSDCSTGYCDAAATNNGGFGTCRLAKPNEFCTNGAFNADLGETCKDGGGPCSNLLGQGCADGDTCLRDEDCESYACHKNTCVSCGNGVLDGVETDVDCGGINSAGNVRLFPSSPSGSTGSNQTAAIVAPGKDRVLSTYNGCDVCEISKKCKKHDDCEDFCDLSASTPICISCSDNIVQSFLKETDVDCGGSICPKRCTNGKTCTKNTDCLSNDCFGNLCVSCSNNQQDGDESSIDCGGSHCKNRCRKNLACTQSTDCATGYCTNGANAYNTWTITIASQTFTEAKGVAVTQGSNSGTLAVAWDGTAGTVLKVKSDVGQTFTTSQNIAVGQTSVLSAGGGIVSATSALTQNKCDEVPPKVHCSNGVKDKGESFTDCGWTCSMVGKLCLSGQACESFKDCKSGKCHNSKCTSCTNSVKDSDETDVNCGGSCSPCRDGKTCTTGTDCASGFCTSGICTSCFDQLKNNGESDIDCGGSSCKKCGDMMSCNTNKDCSSNFCLKRGTSLKSCVTKSPALLDLPSDGAVFTGQLNKCELVTSKITIRPSISNASGWSFCQLQATVSINHGGTLSFNHPEEVSTQINTSPERGKLTASTLSFARFQGTPPSVENFLSRQIRFCPSCLPREYLMRISLTTLGRDVHSPCPTDQTIHHYISARTASIQSIKMLVRNASCTLDDSCTTSKSLLSGAKIRVNAGACFDESVLSSIRGATMNIPLSNPNQPTPSHMEITISKAGFANVTIRKQRFDGQIDLGTFYLVPSKSASLYPNPILKGFILDASTNNYTSFKSNKVIVKVSCYRGYGVTSGVGLVSSTTINDDDGSFSFPDLEPGLYTIVASDASNMYISNFKTSSWHNPSLSILMSPVVPEGSMRIVLSWNTASNGIYSPTDLDLHVKFKPKSGTASSTESPEARRMLAVEDVISNNGGYGDVEDAENEGQGAGYGISEDNDNAAFNEESSEERECDVFEFNRVCGGALFEVSSNNNTGTLGGGGESILLRNMHQTVYTLFIRNYLADYSTEYSDAILEMYDNTGKRDTIHLPSIEGVNYATGETPKKDVEWYTFQKEATYARMACLNAVGGDTVGIFSVGRYDQHPTSSLAHGQCPPTNERNFCKKIQNIRVNSASFLFFSKYFTNL
jgi:hypothetical protein